MYYRNGLTNADFLTQGTRQDAAAAGPSKDVPMGDADNEEEPPRPFLGDYFGIVGEYSERDFGWLEGDDRSPLWLKRWGDFETLSLLHYLKR